MSTDNKDMPQPEIPPTGKATGRWLPRYEPEYIKSGPFPWPKETPKRPEPPTPKTPPKPAV
jgi:hypothetical protein